MTTTAQASGAWLTTVAPEPTSTIGPSVPSRWLQVASFCCSLAGASGCANEVLQAAAEPRKATGDSVRKIAARFYLGLAQVWLDAAAKLDGLPATRIAPEGKVQPDAPAREQQKDVA